MKKIALLFIFITGVTLAQIERKIDSLERFYHTEDLNSKLKVANQLFELYIYHKPEIVRSELKKLTVLAEKQKNNKGIVIAYNNYMALYNVQAQFDSTVYYGNKALELIKKTNDLTLYSNVNQNLIWAYSVQGDFKKAEEISFSDLKTSLKTNQWEALSKSYFGLGNTFFYQNKFPEAIEAYQKVDSILGKHDPYQKTLVNNNINIAQLFLIQKDFDNAEKYLKKAEKICIHNNHTYGLATINLYRGAIEKEKHHPEKGIPFLLKAKEAYESFNSDYDLAEIYYYLGDCYYELNDFENAILYHQKSLPLQEKVENPLGVANSNFTLGRIAKKKNNLEDALLKITKALSIYEDLNDQNVVEHQGEAYKILSEIYDAQENYKLANRYLKKHLAINDTLITNRNQTAFKELEAKYQTEKKEQEIALLTSKHQVAEKQKYIYIIISLLLLATGFFLFFGYKNKIRTAQKLEELNTLKSRFFANISHEFRTPLTLIKSPVQQLQKEATTEQEKQLELIDRNANRMLELVDQLLELSKIDSGQLQLILKEGNLNDFLHSIAEPFEYLAQESNKKLEIHFDIPNENYSFDKDVLEKITTNLLHNAIKYSDDSSIIKGEFSVANQTLKVSIRNSNATLTKTDLQKLFERFYQKNTNQTGAGIGLALVKELITLYEGTIHTNLENDQLTIAFEIPLQTHLKNAVIGHTNDNKPVSSVSLSTESTQFNDELPILLIADDNASIRSVLKDIFKEEFKIFEAKNGEEALKIAEKEIPDCIISDIMMPKIDGLEFTKQIKTNELTSFIPVILLTAKTTPETKLEAIKNQADGYLTKPFQHDLLKELVHQQINERKKLQKRYSQELILKPTEIVIDSVDEKFITRIEEVIHAEITNQDFNTEAFAEKMHVSRMQLHRKLKSLFGVTTTEFIRNERLKIAVELLKNEKLSISEIAYSVGFNDVYYFSKCFKDLYQKAPSEYYKK